TISHRTRSHRPPHSFPTRRSSDLPTVSGRTIGAEAALAVETPGQEVIRPANRPIKSTGGLVIVRGNLAPEGAVIKVSGAARATRSEEHTSELQSLAYLVCRLLLEK